MAGGLVQTDNTRNNFFSGYAPWAELQQQQKTAQLNNQLLQQKIQQSAQAFPMEQQQLQQQLQMGQQQLKLAEGTQQSKIDDSRYRAQQAQALAENLRIINKHADAIEQAKQETAEMQNTLLKPKADLAKQFTDAAYKLTLDDVTRSGHSAAAASAKMQNVKREAELEAKNAEETSKQLQEQTKQTSLRTQGMGQQLVAEKITSFGAFANLMRTSTDAERSMYARMVAEADPTLKYIQDVPVDAWDSLPQQLDKQIMGDKTLLGIKINRDLGLPPSGTQFGMIPDANGMPKFGDAFQRYVKPVADLAAKFSKIVTDRFANNPQGQTVPGQQKTQPVPAIKGATQGLQTSNAAISPVQAQAAPVGEDTRTPEELMAANVENHIAQHEEAAKTSLSEGKLPPKVRVFMDNNPVPDWISKTVSSPGTLNGRKYIPDETNIHLDAEALRKAGVINSKSMNSERDTIPVQNGFLKTIKAANDTTDTTATAGQQVMYKALLNTIYKTVVNGGGDAEVRAVIALMHQNPNGLTTEQKQKINEVGRYIGE